MRKPRLRLVKVFVSICLVFFLFFFVEPASVKSVFAQAQFFPLLVALGFMVAAFGVSCHKWRKLLEHDGVQCSIWVLVKFYLIGLYFNHFLPTSIGGDGVRIYLASRCFGQRLIAVNSVLAERFSGLIALLAVGVVGLCLAPEVLGPFWWAVFLGGTVLALAVVLFLLRPEPREGGRVWGAAFLYKICNGLKGYCSDKKLVWTMVWTSLVFQVLVVLSYCAGAWALSLDISFWVLLVTVPFVALLSMLPFSLNGLGIREGGFVYFLSRAGVEPSESFSLSLVVFGLTLLFSLAGGGLSILGDAVSLPNGSQDDRMVR